MRLAGEAKEIGDQSCVMPDGEAGTRSQLGAGSGAVSPIGANNAGRSAADQALAALGCYRRQATDINTPSPACCQRIAVGSHPGVLEFLIIASTCRSFPSIPLAVSSAGRGASSEALAFLAETYAHYCLRGRLQSLLRGPQGIIVEVAGPRRTIRESPATASRDTSDQIFRSESVGHDLRSVEAPASGHLFSCLAAVPAPSRNIFRTFPKPHGQCASRGTY